MKLFALPTVLLSLLAARCALADNEFSKPSTAGDRGIYSGNPVYKVGDTVDFAWVSDVDKVDIVIWQEVIKKNPDPGAAFILRSATKTSTKWPVKLNVFQPSFNFSLSHVFFLQMYDAENTGKGPLATSHYFNITRSESNKSGASKTKASVSSSTYPTAFSTNISSSNSGGGLSSGATAGIAVTVVVFCLGLIAAAFFMWRRRRQRRNRTCQDMPLSDAPLQQPPPSFSQQTSPDSFKPELPAVTPSLPYQEPGGGAVPKIEVVKPELDGTDVQHDAPQELPTQTASDHPGDTQRIYEVPG